ncbi:MAG TPA: glycosyl hydrolase family 18 protein [Chryseolinea sp.]
MNPVKLVILLLCCFHLNASRGQDTFRIVGYFGLNAAMENPGSKTFKRLTHINLWFLNPDSAGNFSRDLSRLKPFITNAHKKNIKVLFSIGGGSKQPQYHYLLKDDQRAGLVAKLVNEAMKYDVDGIDVDLEGSNIDDNYEKFVVELSKALHEKGKIITAAIAIYYKDQLTDRALAEYDFMNVMSYDRTGPWRPEKPGPHSTYAHAEEDLAYFTDQRNIPKEKLTLGVPFYGYGYGPEITSEAISMNYKQIVETYKGAERVDEWKMPDGKILYYNGIPTIRMKTELATSKASGIMIWQVLGDAPRKKSLLRAISDSAKGK